MAASQALEFILSAKGADGVVREVGKVRNGLAGGGQAAERASRSVRSLTTGLRGIRSAVGGVRSVFVGMLGAYGVQGLVSGLTQANDRIVRLGTAMRSLQFQTRMTASEYNSLGSSLMRVQQQTAHTREELVGILDAAADFSTGYQTALDNLESIVDLADLSGMGGQQLGQITQAGGQGALYGAVEASRSIEGISEDQFGASLASALSRLAPEFRNNDAIQRLTGIVAAAPGLGSREWRGLFRQMMSPATREKMAGAGITAADPTEALIQMARAYQQNPQGEQWEGIPDAVMVIVSQMAENWEDMLAAQAAYASGATPEGQAKIEAERAAYVESDEYKAKQAQANMGLAMEEIAKALMPTMVEILKWIAGGVGRIVEMVGLWRGDEDMAGAGRTLWEGQLTDEERRKRAASGELWRAGWTTTADELPDAAARGLDREADAIVRSVVGESDEQRRRETDAAWSGGGEAGMAETGAPNTIGRGLLAAAARVMVRVTNNINPESASTTVDAELDGQRVPTVVEP
jgi:hypothetical protein